MLLVRTLERDIVWRRQMPLFALSVAAALLLADTAMAQEFPTTGQVYNTRENNFLTYDCSKRSGENRIDCKFVQISIRKKAKPEDLEGRISDAKKQFSDQVKGLEKTCPFISIYLMAIK